jgi:DNA end-binding protein Ku
VARPACHPCLLARVTGYGTYVARPIWTGSIGFGLVNVPVRLFSATEEKDIHFHQFQARTGRRIHYKRVAEGTGREVAYEDIERGYEISDGKWVMLTDEELDAIAPGRSRTIEIEQFVDLAEIDPIYFATTYYLAPDSGEGASRGYRLLVDTMADQDKIAIGRFVMRTKQYLAAMRPKDGVLLLETMLFPDEIRDAKSLPGLPVTTRITARQRQVAEQLIDSLTERWDPKRFHDTYRERVLKLIRDKGKGKETVIEAAEEQAPPVTDLLAALEASLGTTSPPRRSSGRSGPTRKAKRARRSPTKRHRRRAA